MTIIANVLGILGLVFWVLYGLGSLDAFPSGEIFASFIIVILTVIALIKQKKPALITSFIAAAVFMFVLPLFPVTTAVSVVYYVLVAIAFYLTLK